MRRVYNTTAILVLLFANFFPLAAQQNVQAIRLNLLNPNDENDQTQIKFLAGATVAEDPTFDTKPKNFFPFGFYSKINTDDFEIQALPPLTTDRSIPLSINTPVSGSHSISLYQVQNLDETVVIILEDLQTGTFHNLSQTPLYRFTLNNATGIQRFIIHLNAPLEIVTSNESCDGKPGALQITQSGNFTWNFKLHFQDSIIGSGNSWNGVKNFSALTKGNYTLKLSYNNYEVEKEITIGEAQPVQAQFEMSDDAAMVNDLVHFFDHSNGATNFFWDYGDGNSATGTAFPSHQYKNPGDHEVTFIASNHQCSDTLKKTIHIKSILSDVGLFEKTDLSITSNGNFLIIEPQNTHAKIYVHVYSLLGQKIYEGEAAGSEMTKIPLVAKNNYVLVKVLIDEKFLVKKIFLQ